MMSLKIIRVGPNSSDGRACIELEMATGERFPVVLDAAHARVIGNRLLDCIAGPTRTLELEIGGASYSPTRLAS
jgi:hypothetical protein